MFIEKLNFSSVHLSPDNIFYLGNANVLPEGVIETSVRCVFLL